MSRVQLALRVADLEGSITFYSKLFGVEPAKRRPGYANFAITEPPLKLVLIEGETGEPTRMDHLGVEVEHTDQVTAATQRLKDVGLATFEENDTSCCYALQDKVWVHGPGQEPWEVYVVKADADSLGKSQEGLPEAATCCTDSAQQTAEGAKVAVAADVQAGGCCWHPRREGPLAGDSGPSRRSCLLTSCPVRVTLAGYGQVGRHLAGQPSEVVGIRFSLFYEHQLPRPWGDGAERRLYRDALEQVEIADRVGFDYVWEVEHHFLEEYSHSSAPEVFLAAASQRTKRIRLGHGIVQVPPPVNHPARVVERVATLDLVSDGRVDFGTGEASSMAELGGFGVPRGEKRAMWQDAMDALTRMFVEEPFAGWDSPYLQMPPRNVIPKTVQKPHPPLWVACSRRETIHFAARNGIGALSFSFTEPEDAGVWVQEYYRLLASEECVPAGFAVNPNVAVVLPMMCHEDEATAIERGIDGAHFFGFALAHYYGTSPHEPGRTSIWDDFLRQREAQGYSREIINADDAPLGVRIMQRGVGSLRGAIGTPEQVAELVRRYEAVGVDQMIFVLQAGPNRHEHICESIELFGEQVIPRFAEGREERERAKAERLAPAIEAALARRQPPRRQAPYRIDETAELARATRNAGRASLLSPGELMAAGRAALRTRGRRAFARLVSARSDEQLERGFGPAVQRIFFAGMVRAFDPKTAMGFHGEVEFRLRRAGAPAGASVGETASPAGEVAAEETSWAIEISGDRARVRAGRAREPVVGIRIGAADFLRLVTGEVQPPALALDGRLEIDGDLAVAPRIGEMFGAPSPY